MNLYLVHIFRNIKTLNPISMIANIFQMFGFVVVMFYILRDVPKDADIKYVGNFMNFPILFGSAMLCVEG